MHCKFCGTVLPAEKTGRRPKEYCHQAHRQADFRRRQSLLRDQEKAAAATIDPTLSELLANARATIATYEQQIQEREWELTQAKARIKKLEQERAAPRLTWTATQYQQIRELEHQNALLEFRLSSYARSKAKRYDFPRWLRTAEQTTFVSRLVSDLESLPAEHPGHHEQYEAYLRRLKYSDDDLRQVADLWQLMLEHPRAAPWADRHVKYVRKTTDQQPSKS